MNVKDFIDELFKELDRRNLEEYEIYYMSSGKSTVKVFTGEVDSYSDSTTRGISLRVKRENKMGYSYSESLTESDIDYIIEEALNNAQIIENEEVEPMHDGSGEYMVVEDYNPALPDLSVEERVEFLSTMEKTAMERDPRITSVNYCMFGMGESERVIKNSKGMDLSDRGNSAYTYLSVVAKEGDLVKTGAAFKVSNEFAEFDPVALAEEAVEKAVKKLDTISGVEGELPVIIRNEAFGDMLGAFSGVFSAESVQKGISKLKGQLGEVIASSAVTLVDDPHLEKGLGSTGFDSEGYPTKYKEIIAKGKLESYLYNLKTAKIDGVESTGNASKGSYKGTIGISPSNFYILEGERSPEEISEEILKGVYIDSFAGLHSGINPISGDFSLAAEGFAIVNGEKTKALKQITVAGNYFQLLKDIVEVANDLSFGLSSIGSPSISVKSLSIAAD